MDPVHVAKAKIEKVIAQLEHLLDRVPDWFTFSLLEYDSVEDVLQAVDDERNLHISEIAEWLAKKSKKSQSRIFRVSVDGCFASTTPKQVRQAIFEDIYGVLVKTLARHDLSMTIGRDRYVYVTKPAGTLIKVSRK